MKRDLFVKKIIAAILLHGVSFDFLYVVGQIYVNEKSTAATRGQAQGLFVFVTTGLGQLVGTLTTGWLFNGLVEAGHHTPEAWRKYWAIPAVLAALVVLAYVLLFHDRAADSQRTK